jgi:hypothetical protein
MAKPVVPFEWATDPTYTTGPDVGTPTKVAPSAGEIDSGFVRNSAAVAQHVNWLFGSQVQPWLTYLSGLSTDSEFLGGPFAWTGAHTHTQEHAFDAPKTYSKWLPLTSGQSSDITKVYYQGTIGLDDEVEFAPGNSGTDTWTMDLDLPTGAVVTGLHLAARNTLNGNEVVELTQFPIDNTTGAQGAPVSMRSLAATGATAQHLTSVPVAGGSPSQTIDRSANRYRVFVAWDNTGTPIEAQVSGVRVTYTMPGYRNG